MSVNTTFTIRKEPVASAGESVIACKQKILNLARNLDGVQTGLRGSQGALEKMADVVKSLQEGMEYNAERVERVGATARWCAVRYGNADRALLGQPLSTAATMGKAPVKPAAPAGLAEILAMAEQKPGKDAGSGQSALPSSVSPESQDKKDPRLDENGRPTETGWYDNYTTEKDEWKKSWKYTSKSQKYDSAYVEVTEKDGKKKETVKAYQGLAETGYTLSFLTATKGKTYNVTDTGGGISSFDNAVKALNQFERDHTKRGDWVTQETWQREDDPENPGEKKTKKLTKEEAAQNRFSQDIVGTKVVDYREDLVKYSAAGVSAQAKGDAGEAGISASVLDVSVSAGASAGLYYVMKDGKKCLAVGMDGDIGASFTAAQAKGNAKANWKPGKAAAEWLGEEFDILSAEVKGEAKVGHAEAKASGKARYIEGKGLEVAVEGGAGAYLAKASGTVSGTALGIKASATGEVSVGVGLKGSFGYTGGKLRAEVGAALGVGAKISFDLDVGAAVDAVKTTGTKVGMFMAEKVVDAVANVQNTVKKVENAINSLFSWW